jgi:small-conductance mechanosensitive channel
MQVLHGHCRSVQRAAGLLVLLASMLVGPVTWAQDGEDSPAVTQGTEQVADVTLDGTVLFPLRGIAAYPARQRAAAVRKRIVEFAADPSRSIDELRVVDEDDRSRIATSTGDIVSIIDADAELEGIDRALLANVYLEKIKAAVEEYRELRSAGVLTRRAVIAVGVVLVTGLLLWGVIRLFRWLETWARNKVSRGVGELATRSKWLIKPQQVWKLLASLMRLLRIIAVVVLIYFLLNTVLGLFPWTRGFAKSLLQLVLHPLQSIALGFVDAIPDIAFLVVLFFVVRYILTLIRVFFDRMHHGYIRFEGFEPEWAMPTYKILRLLIVAFALVIAYPYIPGSDSLAFKGVSVFLGVIFSLGSTSFVSGAIAGLTMTYRGAFKEGDRITIGEVTGVVTEIRLMVTRIRTAKNEVVVVPNTIIIDNYIVNYSKMARENKLILHTEVSIGYDTPWRQVEAMLLEAAARTEGVLGEPQAFVLQKSLGDFAVTYELNVYSSDDAGIPARYSELHANIQDVFNEYGVQIMSPSYEQDPDKPKVVPREHWYAAPAKQPGSDSSNG